jgi:hypothetical protein
VNIPSIVATAASATVVLAALAHGLRKLVRFCQDLAAAAKAGAAAAKTAADRSAQLEPNGGSSVKDSVVRIEAHLKAQDAQIAELRKQIPPPRGRWRY